MENLEEGKNISFIKEFGIGIFMSILTSLILMLILAILLSTTNLKEDIINPGIIFINTLSLLIGGFLVSKKLKTRGIINGAILGAVYMIFMYIFSSLLYMNFSLNIGSLIMIGLGILGGAIGGILGVNS